MDGCRSIALMALAIGLAGSCSAPREKGDKCEASPPKQQFYFDPNTAQCQPFFYLGCNGNDNRFATKAECKARCSKFGTKTKSEGSGGGGNTIVEACALPTDAKISDKAKQCSSNSDCDKKWTCSSGFCCPSKDYTCNLPANQGTQINGQVSKKQKFVWLRGVSNCLPFSYFGIDGNFNNFPTYDACVAHCKP